MIKLSHGAAVIAALLSTAACATAADARPKKQTVAMIGSAPTLNPNPLGSGFACVNQITAQAPAPIRVSVGKVGDYTGKFSNEASEGGFRVTQGGALMVTSALGKITNIDIIERLDTGVADIDRAYALNKMLRDTPTTLVPTTGMYEGSDYFIVGGITEVNYNLRSSGAEAAVSNIGGGSRIYTMNVAVDLRIIDSKTLKAIKTVTIQKQITGYENKFGLFNFFGDYLVDLNLGSKGQEPLQLGVRSALELAVLELVASVSPNKDYFYAECRPQIEATFGK